MPEDKRPLLSLKRPAGKATPEKAPEPVQVRRKKIITVNAAPERNAPPQAPAETMTKEERAAAKAARRAARVAERRALEEAAKLAARPKVRYVKLKSLDDAVSTLRPWWPGLFTAAGPRFFKEGLRDALFSDIRTRSLPLSHKQVVRALKSLTRSEVYLAQMVAGAWCYDITGEAVAQVTPEDECYARERMVREHATRERREAHYDG